MDQIPDESVPLDQPSHINETRRRRTRRLIVPSGKTERALYVNEIAKRLVPSLDFYLFSALCGLVLAVAILLDHPAIYILAALLAPFMAPLVGWGFSTAVGSFKFFLQSLGSLAIGSALIFFGGMLSGWISKLIPGFSPSQVRFHTAFSIADLILLLIGTILAVFLTVRVPKQKSMVASVALAYEVYLPIGVAGFSLTSGLSQFFGPALQHSGITILLVVMIGAIVLAFMRLRPFTVFGYLLTVLLLGGTVYALIMSSAMRTGFQPQPQTTTAALSSQVTENSPVLVTETPKPPASATPTISIPGEITATNTLVPTRTPTVTNTPKPAEIWATINVDLGAYIRMGPCSDNTQCPKNGNPIPNKTPVLVLAFTSDGTWVQVQIPGDGRQGWVSRSYLSFE